MITNKEAIAYFKRHLDLYCVDGICREAEEMAIKALEQKPCEDAISRQAVLSMQYRIDDSATLSTRDVVNVDDIEDLPPVTPQQKTGHWINIDETHSKCDRCWAVFEITSPNGEINYCPNCGAKMESEDKGMYIACKKCKYNYDNECIFYDMGSGNEIDMPCYREKELIRKASDYFVQAFVGAESEGKE